MTIEKMTMLSYILLAFAIILGITAVVLFFTLKIPKAYRIVKGQKKKKIKRRIANKEKQTPKTKRLKESFVQESETVTIREEEVHFHILQDITFVHVDKEC